MEKQTRPIFRNDTLAFLDGIMESQKMEHSKKNKRRIDEEVGIEIKNGGRKTNISGIFKKKCMGIIMKARRFSKQITPTKNQLILN